MNLLERSNHLDELHEHLRMTSEGAGRLVFLGGEAGIGKTSLIEHFARTAGDVARVSVLSCDGLTTPGPFGPLFDIAEALGPDVERVLTERAPRDLIFRTVLSALRDAPGANVLVGEDAHWTDEATLELIRFLGRRIGRVRTLLIITYRDDELGPHHPLRRVLGDLVNEPAVHRMWLPSLSAAAVGTLTVGTTIDPVSLHQRTGGNPFFVTETIAASSPELPTTVRDAVLARASRLSSDAGAILDAAATIGVIVEPDLLAAVIGGHIDDAVDECISGGMIRPFGQRIAFRHGIARDVILSSMSSPRRRALHRRILREMQEQPALAPDLAHLAHHAEEAGDRDAVLMYAPAAAQKAAAFKSHREAAAQYARALRFADQTNRRQRASLLENWLHECHNSGQFENAIQAAEELVSLARSAQDETSEAQWLAWLAWSLVLAGRNPEAETWSQAALDILESVSPGPIHLFAYFVQATLRMHARDFTTAIAWGERAIALARSLNDNLMHLRSLAVVGITRLVGGDPERGRTELEASLALAHEAGLDTNVAAALSFLGSGHGEIFRLVPAERYLTQGIAYTADRDLDRWRLYMVAWLALTRLYQGRWSEAVDLAVSVVSATSATIGARIVALVALGQVRARQGDPVATAVLDEALGLAETTGHLQRLAPVRAARAEAAWLGGDRERAATEARTVFDLAVDHEHPWHIGALSYWRWLAGDLTDPPPGAAEPFALQMGGDWKVAAASWRDLDCPYEAARALAESDDEHALREALATFDRLGGRPAAAQVTKRLRDRGARTIPRGPRPSTRANPALLTARELDVLPLIMDGLTDHEIAAKLFLSPKTVGHHVSAILAKLHVSSRRDARHAAIRLHLLPQDRESPTPI